MRLFWGAVVAIEVIALVVFSRALASSDYVVRMPPGVRHGRSIESLIAERAVWLMVVFAVFDLALLMFIKGLLALEQSDHVRGALTLGGAAVVFLSAGVLFVGFVLFGFAQY